MFSRSARRKDTDIRDGRLPHLLSAGYLCRKTVIMPGETNLQKMLRLLEPVLQEGDYVFCALHQPHIVPVSDCLMLFREDEAETAIVRKEKADALELAYDGIFAWITLTVHSSLEAVGLTAAFSQALAARGISCNVVAAFYHDHIFVKRTHAAAAMEALAALSQ